MNSKQNIDFDNDDWETADLNINPLPRPSRNFQEYILEGDMGEEIDVVVHKCDICENEYDNLNELNIHRKGCNLQELKFWTEYKHKVVPKSAELKERMKKTNHKDLDKLWEWVNYTISLPEEQEYGTGESFGIHDLHPRLSHFIIWALSQYLIGINVFDKASVRIETAMGSFNHIDWENQAATNKLCSFLNNLVKKKNGRPISPIPIPDFSKKDSVRLTDIKLKPTKSKEEAEKEKEIQNICRDLGRAIIDKGFSYNLNLNRSVSFLQSYLELTDLILNQEKVLGLEPIHITNQKVENSKMRNRVELCGTTVGLSGDENVSQTIHAPYPDLGLNEEMISKAINSVKQTTELFICFKENKYSNTKDGLDALLMSGLKIDGLILFPFHQIIIEWLNGKKINGKIAQTFKVKCNQLKSGSSLLHCMKSMGQLDAIFEKI